MQKLARLFRNPAVIFGAAWLLSACSVEDKIPGLAGIQLSPTTLTILQVVVLAVMLGGLLSLLLVIIPGLTIIWLAALVYGVLSGFDLNSGLIFIAMTICMLVGNFIDQFLMGAKAKKSGASGWSIGLSMLAALIFSILFPPFGGLIAALIVLFTIETVRLRNWRKAGHSTSEMAMGCATAVLARAGIGLLMIALWLLWVWLSGNWPFLN